MNYEGKMNYEGVVTRATRELHEAAQNAVNDIWAETGRPVSEIKISLNMVRDYGIDVKINKVHSVNIKVEL